MLLSVNEIKKEGNLIGKDQKEQLYIQECIAQEDYGGPLCQYDEGRIVNADTGESVTSEVEAAIHERVKKRSVNGSLKAQQILAPIERMEDKS